MNGRCIKSLLKKKKKKKKKLKYHKIINSILYGVNE